MKRLIVVMVVLALAVMSMLAGPAGATTTFSDTGDTAGKGFAGKGDLQTAWGWSDAKLQTEAGKVNFDYTLEQNWTVVCTYLFENNKFSEERTNVSVERADVTDTVVNDTRKNNLGKVTGFNLTGFGIRTGVIPKVEDDCSVGQFGGKLTAVTLNPAQTQRKLWAYQDVLRKTGKTLLWHNGVSICCATPVV